MSILLIEDDHFDAQKITRDFMEITDGEIDIEWRTTLEDGVETARSRHFDAIILDLGLPDRSGKETLVYARVASPHMPILVLTGEADTKIALWSVKHGAQEYLIKGEISGPSLLRAVRYAIERHGMLSRIEEYAREAREAQNHIQRGLLSIRTKLNEVKTADDDSRAALDAVCKEIDVLCAPRNLPLFD